MKETCSSKTWRLPTNDEHALDHLLDHREGLLRVLIAGFQLLLTGTCPTEVLRGLILPEVAPVAPLDGIENCHLRKLILDSTFRLLPHLLTVPIMPHTGQSIARLM